MFDSEPDHQPKRYQCRHVFPSGQRCGSPALRHQPLCYWHQSTRRPVAELAERHACRNSVSSFHIDIPDDRSAIQLAIGTILQRIAANEIDSKRAGLLLYGLQIAALNLQRSAPAHPDPKTAPQAVDELIQDDTYGTLAPEAELQPPAKRVSFAQTLMDLFDKEQAEKAQAEAEEEAAKAAETPTILPTLQACRERIPTTVRSRTPKSQSEQTHPKTSKLSSLKSSKHSPSPSETLDGRMRIQYRGLPRLWKTFAPPCDSSAAAPATPSQWFSLWPSESAQTPPSSPCSTP
jgi:hypothetical protein